MEVRIKEGNGYVDADWTIEGDVMIVSPKEVKFVPKDGDVVNADGCICIFKKERGSIISSFEAYIILNNQQLRIGINVFYAKFRPATEEEKKKLFDKLAEEGYSWDAERKELVKLKWKPKEGDLYYAPFLFATIFQPISKFFTSDSGTCLEQKNVGWCFKTPEECERFCKKLNEVINQAKP